MYPTEYPQGSANLSGSSKNNPGKNTVSFWPIRHKQFRKTSVILTLSVLATVIAIPIVVRAASDADGHTSSRNIVNVKATSEAKPIPAATTSDNGSGYYNKATQSKDSNNSQTTVTVNGEPIPVPSNGSYSKTTDDSNGHTQINVNSSSQQSSSSISTQGSANTNAQSGSVSNQSSSNVHVNVHTDSNSEPEDD